MARLAVSLVLLIAATGIVAADQKSELVNFLKRLLDDETAVPSCKNQYEGKRATRGLTFTACQTDADCTSSELCCPTQFLDVCIKKVYLFPKGEKTTTTVPPPPPTVNVPVDEEATSNICSTLPQNSLYMRGLTGLVNLMRKREPLISVTLCEEKALNNQGNCSTKEVCCKSPFGPSCYPLSDTSAGSNVWCSDGKLCENKE